MKKIIIVLSICLSITALNKECEGAFTRDDIGTTGAPFLKIGVGARAIAMGEAYGALADEVNAIYWNPAGLINIQRREISFMHAAWFDSINYEYVAFAEKTTFGAIGFAFNYLSYGAIPRIDIIETELGTFNASDIAFIVSYAREIFSIPIGLNIKVIYSKIDDEKATAIAGDLGFQSKFNLFSQNFIIGGVVQNYGTKLTFINEGASLPLNIKGSFACKGLLDDHLSVGIDYNAPIDNSPYFCVGGEFQYFFSIILVAIRGGYKFADKTGIDGVMGPSGGIGLYWRDKQEFGIDYAFVPFGNLGNTHRISFIMKF